MSLNVSLMHSVMNVMLTKRMTNQSRGKTTVPTATCTQLPRPCIAWWTDGAWCSCTLLDQQREPNTIQNKQRDTNKDHHITNIIPAHTSIAALISDLCMVTGCLQGCIYICIQYRYICSALLCPKKTLFLGCQFSVVVSALSSPAPAIICARRTCFGLITASQHGTTCLQTPMYLWMWFLHIKLCMHMDAFMHM